MLSLCRFSAQSQTAVFSPQQSAPVPSLHHPDFFSGGFLLQPQQYRTVWAIRSGMPYSMVDLSTTELGMAFLRKQVQWTASLQRLGNQSRASWTIRAGYGQRLSDDCALSFTTDWTVQKNHVGSLRIVPDASVKLLYRPADKMVIGLEASGIRSLFQGALLNNTLVLASSVGVDVNESVFFFGLLSKESALPLMHRWGIYYQLPKKASCRMLFQHRPFLASMMLFFPVSALWKMGVGAAYHPVLGLSPTIQLQQD
jgi:hypothetical protein